ncbi:MAG: hypothetical protein HY307_01515, partial [Arcobacter sp.]|nr:hypothetical protein [Arcobacter sp.]
MKSKSIWLLVLIGILTYSYGAEKQANMKKPVELVFDTKVSCKDVKPYLLFLNTVAKNEIVNREIFCSNDDTDGKLLLINKETNNLKIIHEPTNTIFSDLGVIGNKVHGITKDNKAGIQPIEIAYFDLNNDGVKEIFIKRVGRDNFCDLDILKQENGKFKKLLPYGEVLRMDE